MNLTMATIGDNLPPPDLLTGELLRERLLAENAALLSRRDQLLAAESRLPQIDNDDMAGKVTDYVKQITAAAKAADTARIGAKEPYLEGGRGVDGFFRHIADPLLAAKTRVERKLTEYLRAKADAERRRREEAERLARAEADRLRREAEEKAAALATEQELAPAVEAEHEARIAEADAIKAEQSAAAKPAEMSQVRAEFGALSSLRTDWVFDPIDRATVDLEALRMHLPMEGLERAVRSFIKAGGRELRGTKIYETTKAVVR